MSPNLVSVIIPCYNAENFIGDAIKSALEQSYADCEIIVTDDGSTDGSLEVIKSFGERVKWETGPNRGGCAARNRGLSLAAGNWIQFLDADDYLAPKKIETQLKLLAVGNPRKVANCPWRFFDETGLRDLSPRVFWRSYQRGSELLVDMWLDGSFFNPACWLVSREIIDRAGPWNESLAADQDGEFFGRVLLQAEEVIFAEAAEAFYRMPQSDNVSRSVSAKSMWSRAESIRVLSEGLGGATAATKVQAAIRRRWLGFAYFSAQYDSEWMALALEEAEKFPASRAWPDDVSGPLLKSLAKLVGMPNAIRLRRRLLGMVSS